MTVAIRAWLYPFPTLTPPQHLTPAEAVAASLTRHSSARAS